MTRSRLFKHNASSLAKMGAEPLDRRRFMSCCPSPLTGVDFIKT